MSESQPTPEQMAKRVARYRDLRPYKDTMNDAHGIPPEALKGMEIFSITNGPRTVAPLKKQGHHHVLVEIDLHPKTLGVNRVVPSEFGETIRSMLVPGGIQ